MLRTNIPLQIKITTNRKSKIYHTNATTQQIKTTLKTNNYQISTKTKLIMKLQINNNHITISIDTSNKSLHKHRHKQNIGKTPMHKTLTSLFLHNYSYQKTEPILNPIYKSSTFIIKATKITAKLYPKHSRNFTFKQLANFNPTT